MQEPPKAAARRGVKFHARTEMFTTYQQIVKEKRRYYALKGKRYTPKSPPTGRLVPRHGGQGQTVNSSPRKSDSTVGTSCCMAAFDSVARIPWRHASAASWSVKWKVSRTIGVLGYSSNISQAAWIPVMYGIAMSMIIKCGASRRFCLTLSAPSAASETCQWGCFSSIARSTLRKVALSSTIRIRAAI